MSSDYDWGPDYITMTKQELLEGRFLEKPFAQMSVLLWLVAAAACHEGDLDYFGNGKAVVLQRGQIFSSFRQLGDVWGWSPNKVHAFLEDCRDHEELTFEPRRNGTLITMTSPIFDLTFCSECWSKMSNEEIDRRRREAEAKWERMDMASPLKPRPESRRAERHKLTNALRYEVMRRDGFQCVLCGAKGRDAELQVDHITPLARGGRTEPDNLRTLCRPCNSGKGTKLDSES